MNLLFNKLNDDFLVNNKLIFKKYKPIAKIGSGSYGNVYSAKRIEDNCMFAMKTEKITKIKKTLESEAYYLYILQGGFGIPKFISYGRSNKYYILIQTLLDKNLYEIFIKNKKICTITDAC
jgi:predicted Ser/Thr protein kinase